MAPENSLARVNNNRFTRFPAANGKPAKAARCRAHRHLNNDAGEPDWSRMREDPPLLFETAGFSVRETHSTQSSKMTVEALTRP
jgi:hypothetical protein